MSNWIGVHQPVRITVLTGAGISAESGIPTFRGQDGLWKNYSAEQLATPQAFARNPQLVWEWYEWRRDIIRTARPNAAHAALARLEQAIGSNFTLITQNVDGLHAAARSNRILELHGNIFRVRCTVEGRVLPQWDPLKTVPPQCECGALLRPDVVWFGEALQEPVLTAAAVAVREAHLFLIIGTSGAVYPAAGLISLLRGTSVEINPESTPMTDRCTFSIAQNAVTAVPRVVDMILGGAQ